MKSRVRGVRLPESLAREVERERKRTGQNWSQTLAELVEEAVKMRRAPGIAFRAGPTGRRPTLPGTGFDVWEVVAAFKACGEEWESLVEEFPQLEPVQLRAALNYYELYELYPEEIEERLEREQEWTPGRLYQRHPFMRPTHASGSS